MSVNLKALIGKLNGPTRSTLEAAAGLCLSRTHYNIEIEHYLMKLMEASDTDAARIFRHFEVNQSRLAGELTRSLDKLKSGNARTPAISPTILRMMTQAWTTGSIDYGAWQVRTGFTLLALVADEELARIVREVSKEMQKIEPEALKKDFVALVHGSQEDEVTEEAPGEGAPPGPRGTPAGGKTANLDQFTVNLTANAKSGKLDPVLGRDTEIRQIIDILMRRRQNNPILTGEAGVGKSAVVEGFALRIVQGDVPPALKNVTLRTLDLALLQAGAGIKGEFENRLKGLIEEVKSSPTPIILFIDEAHTMIGAGGQAGQGDAANLLKPALARGELRTIAATTWSEYKKYFEKDPALARRFQVVKVEEPEEPQCMTMLRGVAASLEKHHKVRILDEGVSAAVRLSHRFLAGRQLPDKAVSVLDTACARLALGQNATPPAIEDATRQIDDYDLQERVLARESAAGADHAERLAEIREKRAQVAATLAELKERFEKESALVNRVREIRGQLEEGTGEQEPLRAELEKLNAELAALQGETPLMRVCVDGQIVGEVISAWTGIPTGKMVKDEVQTVLKLEGHLGARVIGQDHALEGIAQRIRTSRAGLEDPKKPKGVFLLVGPSGVGKTETALALADLMYGGERNLITINMSEFQEAHTVSTLKGSPPGYVGYGEGGVLTEAVRRHPYSVVLLDEVEKAHPDVLELFFQVFDKGSMEDGEGREIDFKNTIILLTSNAATDTMMKLCADPETMPSPEGIVKAIKPELNKIFKPAFLGRLVVIPYYPLRDEAMKNIIRLKLGKIQKRTYENHKIQLVCDGALIDEIARRCTEVESGARNVDNILTNTLLPEISRQLLSRIAEGEKLESIRVDIGADGNFVYS
ncbi:MAG TPA: type VI secretion system ATPase TssH [Bryobacteraceae bacterium]|nr:type VI secretion system ATPase TssH [Bryobacteraceae bacterium]